MNANFIGYAAAVVWIILPIVYLATAPDWYRTRTGRALVWLLGSTAGLFLLLITGGLFGDYPGKPWVRAGVFAAVLYAGVRLAVLFVHLRIDMERKFRAQEAAAVAEAMVESVPERKES